MIRKLRPAFLAFVALMLVTTSVFAAVTFDPATGTGFVGKGDVQVAFGWNNAALQANAKAVTFTYEVTDIYNVTLVWATGNADNPKSLTSHQIAQTTTYAVNAILDGEPRQVKGQNQFTGFILSGFAGDPTTTGELPTVDYVEYVTYTWIDNKGVEHTTEEMPVDANGNLYTEGNNKAVLSVDLDSSTGGLYAHWNGMSKLLP